MTPTTLDGQALLTAILANPADDTVRLVYADCLQENGEGERAEFIRVQCELARCGRPHRELFVTDGAGARLEGLGVALVPRGAGHYSASDLERGLSTETFAPDERVDIYAHLARNDRIGWMRGLKYVKHVADRHEIIFRKDEQSGPWKGAPLVKRADELLSAHGREWVNGVIPGAMPSNWSPHNPTPYLVLPGPSFVNIEFSRGFVEVVTCTLADWLKHGPTIVRQHPIRRVVLSDREPADRTAVNERWYWFRERSASHQVRLPPDGEVATHITDVAARLPSALFDDLEGSRKDIIALPYHTRDDALDALSDACLALAKGKDKVKP